ncbi:SpoIID/LytB domain-containing protein [Nocardioides mesophilus]|uniref:SpoIID/LytB domain-containing protein n=1 Tax=Nocardioides mesophilus TaxID=433659 RepID=A0A7G9RDK7_9ACTN|nr:SpoIID/LytB domain-containing protein [Nocardioides mesophilus]QNN53682.1 SpoIID/LytB domain-containing protein [Nocardioides mesophilus]
MSTSPLVGAAMPARRPVAALTALALLGGALAAVVTSVPAGAVTTDQTYWVPVDKQITVRGHGFGHGHGMSQYGAYGAARQGLTYREILDFYYPGTTWGTVSGQVRVLISADTSSDLVVSPAAGLTLRDLGSGTTYPVPTLDGVKRWRLNVANGRTVVGYLTSRWHRWQPGGRSVLAGDGEFTARAPLTLWTPAGARTYRGALRAASPTAGFADRDTVNVLSMDSYLKGVIPYEMPASWSAEAVRAQAVAARTYASWSRAQAPNRYYQICDTTSCQVYGGVGGEDSRSNAAVEATARQILTYGGGPAFTQFSASSGGWTSAGSVPYLPAKADPYDGHDANGVHDWSVTVDAGRLERTYPAIGTLERIRVTSRDGNGDWRGRVWSMVLDGSKADRTISGDTFRWVYGLRSSWFTIDPTEIMARYARLGGDRSVLGRVRTPEYAVPSGAAQSFDAGQIYWSRAAGARELYGPVLATYRSWKGPEGRLGLPVTGVQARAGGLRARFHGGDVYAREATGGQALLGALARRYRELGGPRTSGLGWPVRGTYPVARGERADFETGRLTWIAATGQVKVRRTS